MSEQDPSPLPTDLAALLRDEARAPDLPDAVKARVARRVRGTTSGPDGGPSAQSRPVAPTSPRRVFGSTMFASGALVGALVGALGVVALRPPRVQVITRFVPAPAPPPPAPPALPTVVPNAPSEPVAPTVERVPALPRPARPTRTTTDGGVAGRDLGLVAERAQIEIASGALARGQTVAALEALEAHARQFPQGRLAEERESLRVQALVRAGRVAEARQQAERFRRRYPTSILRPVVEDAVGTIP